MKHRVLFLSLSNDNDAYVGVVRWDEATRERAKARVARVKEIAEDDDTVTGMTFHSGVTVYDVTGDFEEFLCDTMVFDDKSVYDALEEDRWVVAEVEEDRLSAFEEERLDFSELHVTVYGSFYWEVLRKHCSDVMESMPLRCEGSGYEDLFPKNPESVH